MDPSFSSGLQDLGFEHISVVSERAVHEMNKRINGDFIALKSKWTKFNNAMGGGIQPATLYVVGGRPGVGKSAFSNRLLFDLYETNSMENVVTLYWNFEMPNYKQIIREASNKLQRSVNQLLSSEELVAIEYRDKLKQLAEKMNDYPMYFMDKSKKPSFISRVNDALKNKGVNLIINIGDHTRLVSKEHHIMTEEEKITEYLSEQQKCCVQQESVGILLSQLNRSIETPDRIAGGAVPLLSDFFGADSVGQFANVAMILQRPEMYQQDKYREWSTKNLLVAHVVKNRDGEVGILPFTHQLSYNSIIEYGSDSKV
jgi:replicative DNA helicase